MSAASNREGRRKREDDDEERQGEDDDKGVPVHHDKKLSKKTPPFLDKTFFSILGPGIITGASDDDPSGIATYSQAGAQFGLGILWLTLFQYPLVTVIQEMCARIGLVTGSGLAAVIKKYSRKIVLIISSLLLVANTINIGADIGAMAASIRLVSPQLPIIVTTLFFTAFIILS